MIHNYTPQEIRLAKEIANALKDQHSLGLHLQFARTYKEEDLRKALGIAMSYDASAIKSSRAALYVSIIKRIEPSHGRSWD